MKTLRSLVILIMLIAAPAGLYLHKATQTEPIIKYLNFDITVHGNFLNEDPVMKVLSTLKNPIAAYLDSSNITSALQKIEQIDSVDVSAYWPNRIAILIDLKKPVVSVKVAEMSVSLDLKANPFIISGDAPENLPIMEILPTTDDLDVLHPGEALSAAYQAAVLFAQQSNEYLGRFSILEITSKFEIIARNKTDGTLLRLSYFLDPDDLVKFLEYLIQNPPDSAKEYDLRFPGYLAIRDLFEGLENG